MLVIRAIQGLKSFYYPWITDFMMQETTSAVWDTFTDFGNLAGSGCCLPQVHVYEKVPITCFVGNITGLPTGHYEIPVFFQGGGDFPM